MSDELNFAIAPVISQSNSEEGGTLRCSTATLFSVAANSVVQIGVANPSNTEDVSYAVFNDNTNTKVMSGTLSPGRSASETIPFSQELNVYRIQNQSACGRTGTTPYLSWSASIQQD